MRKWRRQTLTEGKLPIFPSLEPEVRDSWELKEEGFSGSAALDFV